MYKCLRDYKEPTRHEYQERVKRAKDEISALQETWGIFKWWKIWRIKRRYSATAPLTKEELAERDSLIEFIGQNVCLPSINKLNLADMLCDQYERDERFDYSLEVPMRPDGALVLCEYYAWRCTNCTAFKPIVQQKNVNSCQHCCSPMTVRLVKHPKIYWNIADELSDQEFFKVAEEYCQLCELYNHPMEEWQ